MRLYQNVANKVQPSFADDPLEPLYLDDDGNLSSLDNVVPAPMREEAIGGAQPLDSAGTYRMATMRVPAPTREVAFGSVQPLECAVTNIEAVLKLLVPAPRLELGTP